MAKGLAVMLRSLADNLANTLWLQRVSPERAKAADFGHGSGEAL